MANKLDGAIPIKDMKGDEASPFDCKCQTLGQRVLGDGCDECNPELAKELEEDQEELIPVIYLEDLVEQWERRYVVLGGLLVEAEEAACDETIARLKTKSGVIKSMTEELKREIRDL